MPAGSSSPITQRSAARSCAGRAARIAGKSTGANPHSVTSVTARERRRSLPTSAARKRVLRWIASAPSRAQAKIAARYPMLFGSHSATRTPSPTPAARSPAAVRSTRSWKERRLNVPAASVTAAAVGSHQVGPAVRPACADIPLHRSCASEGSVDAGGWPQSVWSVTEFQELSHDLCGARVLKRDRRKMAKL